MHAQFGWFGKPVELRVNIVNIKDIDFILSPDELVALFLNGLIVEATF